MNSRIKKYLAAGGGIAGAIRRLKRYPTANIYSRYNRLITNDSGDILDLSGNGKHLIYVSGSGLDAIYDCTALGEHYNKNAYIGNSYSLPEYFDYPYPSAIYHDPANPYNYKLPDFHHRYWETQNVVYNNYVFAKLTYSATVLQSVDEIIVYSAEQTSTNLTRLLSYINILGDYYGDNIVVNGDFNSSDQWSVGYWVISGGIASCIYTTTTYLIQSVGFSLYPIGSIFEISVDIVFADASTNLAVYLITKGYLTKPVVTGGKYIDYIETDGSYDNLIIRYISYNKNISIDNVIVRRFYQNYYQNEAA